MSRPQDTLARLRRANPVPVAGAPNWTDIRERLAGERAGGDGRPGGRSRQRGGVLLAGVLLAALAALAFTSSVGPPAHRRTHGSPAEGCTVGQGPCPVEVKLGPQAGSCAVVGAGCAQGCELFVAGAPSRHPQRPAGALCASQTLTPCDEYVAVDGETPAPRCAPGSPLAERDFRKLQPRKGRPPSAGRGGAGGAGRPRSTPRPR